MTTEKKLLITGFDPFGGEDVNPSYEVVKALPDKVGSIRLYKQLLPTSYKRAPELLVRYIDEVVPDYVIMLGQAGGRAGVTPERVAINCMDGKLADNDGVVMSDAPIESADAPTAYFSTLPIRQMTEAIAKLSIPAYVSNTAGTFVCNAVMYTALFHLQKTRPDTKAGFIHIPYLPEQAERLTEGKHAPSLPIDDAVLAIKTAIETLNH